MDVHAAVAHPFMSFKKEKRGSGAGVGKDSGKEAVAAMPVV
jgi:hypothetical protein